MVHKQPLSKFLFAFEELENNLHPAVQRRLFLYLRRVAEEEGCYFFLTTHSNVVIDLFGADPLAQILHVTHDRNCARVDTVSKYLHKRSILLDLDVRASDLLQSNVVVWLEGPTDRIYFNRWIELWDEELKEGVHYQCLYSGGALVKGISFDDPEAPELTDETSPEELVEDFIEALRINRHAIAMMDRDKGEGEKLKDHVTRIVKELESIGGIAWVTDGREVENYIPPEIVRTIVHEYGYQMPEAPGQYDKFLEKVTGKQGGELSKSKTKIAKRASELLTRESIENTLDLSTKLDAVCSRIRDWNGLPQLSPRRSLNMDSTVNIQQVKTKTDPAGT